MENVNHPFTITTFYMNRNPAAIDELQPRTAGTPLFRDFLFSNITDPKDPRFHNNQLFRKGMTLLLTVVCCYISISTLLQKSRVIRKEANKAAAKAGAKTGRAAD